MQLKQTWRWFGPKDPVTLKDIKQTGASGIVTALHHIPHGEVWPVEEIRQRKELIESEGLSWDVVESVTIHEDIKTRSGKYEHYIALYQQTLRNLATCGIRIVTYNFMPVNDWTRTDLDYRMPDGSRALYFNHVDMAVFELFILQRDKAAAGYPEEIIQAAEKQFQKSSPEDLEKLAAIVMFGIPGEKKLSVAGMREKLLDYKDIDASVLRGNLVYFLKAICPVADELNLQLAIHPDDPPFNILGLPRVVKNMEDLDYILTEAPFKSNGICFCTGSLGASPLNDLPAMAKKIGDKIHFIHLRNTRRDAMGNFFEADHLDGDTDMYAVMKELLEIQQRKETPIPFRPDHGHQMLDDLHKTTNPGYSCIGRMRGLAELRGLELGICRANGWL